MEKFPPSNAWVNEISQLPLNEKSKSFWKFEFSKISLFNCLSQRHFAIPLKWEKQICVKIRFWQKSRFFCNKIRKTQVFWGKQFRFPHSHFEVPQSVKLNTWLISNKCVGGLVLFYSPGGFRKSPKWHDFDLNLRIFWRSLTTFDVCEVLWASFTRLCAVFHTVVLKPCESLFGSSQMLEKSSRHQNLSSNFVFLSKFDLMRFIIRIWSAADAALPLVVTFDFLFLLTCEINIRSFKLFHVWVWGRKSRRNGGGAPPSGRCKERREREGERRKERSNDSLFFSVLGVFKPSLKTSTKRSETSWEFRKRVVIWKRVFWKFPSFKCLSQWDLDLPWNEK